MTEATPHFLPMPICHHGVHWFIWNSRVHKVLSACIITNCVFSRTFLDNVNPIWGFLYGLKVGRVSDDSEERDAVGGTHLCKYNTALSYALRF
jgi:hypothetical protein